MNPEQIPEAEEGTKVASLPFFLKTKESNIIEDKQTEEREMGGVKIFFCVFGFFAVIQ